MNSDKKASCQQPFRELDILPVQSQYILSILLFVAKNKEQFISNSQIHKINTRQTSDLHIPVANLHIPVVNLHIPVANLHIPVANLHIPIANLHIPVANLHIPIENLTTYKKVSITKEFRYTIICQMLLKTYLAIRIDLS
jgi:hypothetical protein